MKTGLCLNINVSNTTLYIIIGVMACASLATGRPTVPPDSKGRPADCPTAPYTFTTKEINLSTPYFQTHQP